jgi:hypothetical protein
MVSNMLILKSIILCCHYFCEYYYTCYLCINFLKVENIYLYYLIILIESSVHLILPPS